MSAESSQVNRSSEIPATLEVLISSQIWHLLQELLERGTETRLYERTAQNLPVLLLDGLPVPRGTKLQLFYELVFDVLHNQLRHDLNSNDIATLIPSLPTIYEPPQPAPRYNRSRCPK
jgi:hypothetical protein